MESNGHDVCGNYSGPTQVDRQFRRGFTSTSSPPRRTEVEHRTINESVVNLNDPTREINDELLSAFPTLIKCTGNLDDEYASLQSRLKTFESWPPSLAQRPEDLADAGFYYRGSSDKVHCYSCNAGLWQWERSDDPWVEHAKNAPKCTHLRLKKGDAFIKSVIEQLPTDVPSAAPARSLSSDSGISNISESLNNQLESDKDDENLDEAFNKLKLKNIQMKQEKSCKVCLDEEVEVVFIPCGHLVSCSHCAPSLKDCPVCRTRISAVVRAFLA